MAFKKCTSVEAWWKVRGQNLESVRLTIYEKQYFTPVLICSNLVKTFHIVPTCFHLFTPVHTCSHLFTPVHNCSHLFTPVHTCPHLTDYLRSSCNGSFSLNFSIAKAVIFRFHVLSFWRCIFLLTLSRAIQRCTAWVAVPRKNIDPSGSPYYSDHVCSSHNVIFCTFKCSYSSVLRRNLLKLHILTRLIESFPLYGVCSCNGIKMSIPLGAHA